MEWKKAKTILIVTFLVLNVLIAYQLWMNTNAAQQWLSRNELRDETLEKLKNKEIELATEFPNETPQLQEITISFAPSDIATKRQPLRSPIAEEELRKSRTERELAGQIPTFSAYALDPVMTNEKAFVFFQMYDKWPMFEVNLNLYREQGSVVSYSMRYATIEEEVETEAAIENDHQTVLSAYKAVGLLADYVLSEGSVIADIRLGYHGQAYSENTQVLAPKWRVTLESGEMYYVHALNGAVEKKE